MVSFTLAGGENAALDVVARTRLFTLAESLGAVESLIEHPGPHDARVGCRLTARGRSRARAAARSASRRRDDLVADLRQALDAVRPVNRRDFLGVTAGVPLLVAVRSAVARRVAISKRRTARC